MYLLAPDPDPSPLNPPANISKKEQQQSKQQQKQQTKNNNTQNKPPIKNKT